MPSLLLHGAGGVTLPPSARGQHTPVQKIRKSAHPYANDVHRAFDRRGRRKNCDLTFGTAFNEEPELSGDPGRDVDRRTAREQIGAAAEVRLDRAQLAV